MSKATAWMPLWIGDYLADTMRLTTEQHGAYLLLIMDHWKTGPLPDDDAALAAITGLSLPAWRKNKATIARYFKIEGGHWHHKRVEAELERAAEMADKRSTKARRAADARWNAPSNAPSNAQSNPGAMPQQCPLPSPLEEEDSEPDGSLVSEPELRPEEIIEAWNALAGKHSLPKVLRLTPERRRKIYARIRQNSLADWQAALAAIDRSPFLRGEGRNGWRANFDFLLQPSSFTRLVEGTYDQ